MNDIERQIKKIKTEYQDVRTNANIGRLKNDISNVQNIMAENIDLILNRGNKLQGKYKIYIIYLMKCRYCR